MIAPEQVDTVGILELVAEQQQNSLNRVVPTIDKVTDENILLFGQLSTCIISQHTYNIIKQLPSSKILSTS